MNIRALVILGALAGLTSSAASAQQSISGTLPCSQMPALTGAISSAAGSCTTSGSGSSGRILLTSAIDMYVASSGSDAGNGCTDPAAPCATPSHAYQYSQKYYDLGGLIPAVTVHFQTSFGLAAGWSFSGPLTGAVSAASFVLDGGSPVVTSITSTAAGIALFYAVDGANFTVGNLTLSSAGTGGNDILIGAGTVFGSGIWFGSTGGAYIDGCSPTANFKQTGPLTFLNGSDPNIGFAAEDGAHLAFPGSLIVSGAPHWRTAFAQSDLGGILDFSGATITAGAAWGRRFNALSTGIVFTGGTNDPNFLPGNAPGVVDGGYYN